MRSTGLLSLILLLATVVSCTKTPPTSGQLISTDTTQIRPISETEALSDYDAMISSIRALYGPLEYKQRRFGYDFEAEAQTVRAKFPAAKTDSEKLSLFFELLRKLQDGFEADRRYCVPSSLGVTRDYSGPRKLDHPASYT